MASPARIFATQYKDFIVSREDNKVIIFCESWGIAENLKIVLEALLEHASYPKAKVVDEGCDLSGPCRPPGEK